MAHLHIAGGNKDLLNLSIAKIPHGVEYTVHRTIDSLLIALEQDPDNIGLYINPPNCVSPNEDEINKFSGLTANYRGRIALLVDVPQAAFWKSAWEDGTVHEYDGWNGEKGLSQSITVITGKQLEAVV